MTLYELYKLTNYIIRSEERGKPCTLTQFELLVNARQIDYFQKLYKRYESTTNVMDSLQLFKTSLDQEDITIVDSSYFELPEDWFHFSTMSYIDADGKYYPFDIVTKDQAIMRRVNTLTTPTVQNPICYVLNGNMYLFPYDDTLDLHISYLRYPYGVEMSFHVNSDGEIEYYDESSSVSIATGTELEWNEDDQMKILQYILKDLGVSLSDEGIYKYAIMLQNES